MKQKNGGDVISYQTDNNGRSDAQSGDWEKRRKPKVYLIYDLSDKSSVVELRKYLDGEGYYILEPDFEGTLHDRRNVHQHKLITADIILIYYGRENVSWLRTKLLDILKSPGLGRVKPQFDSAIYVPQDVELTTETVLSYRAALIKANDIFPPQPLKEFLNKVRTNHAAVSE